VVVEVLEVAVKVLEVLEAEALEVEVPVLVEMELLILVVVVEVVYQLAETVVLEL
jgi:hypothetical protein